MAQSASPLIAVFSASLVLSGCGQEQQKVQSFLCRSSGTPTLLAHLVVKRSGENQAMIVVKYDQGPVATFRVMEETSAYYSAIEAGSTDAESPASLYFSRGKATVVETFRSSDASRKIRLKRCDGQIDAGQCTAALTKIVRGPGLDLDDCTNPSAAECESWRLGSLITSETQLSCSEIEPGQT